MADTEPQVERSRPRPTRLRGWAYLLVDALAAMRHAPPFRTVTFAAAMGLGSALFADVSGVGDTVDALAGSAYRPLDGLRTASHEVVVVAQRTLSDVTRTSELEERLRAHGARAVITVPFFDEEEGRSQLERDLGLVRVSGLVVRFRCAGTRLERAIDALGVSCERGDRVIRYGPTAVPLSVISAAAILDGDIPEVALRGRVVVVGAEGPFIPRLMSAAGPLPPAHIVAHVLRSQVDGAAFYELDGPPRGVVIAILTLIAAVAVQRTVRRSRLFVSVLVAIVASDCIAFLLGIRLGLGAVAAAFCGVIIGTLLEERQVSMARLGALARRLGRVDDGSASATDAWQPIARLGCWYLGARVCVVLEVPEGEWHALVRATSGASLADVKERRRDSRRDPFRRALVANCARSKAFVASAPHALIVPLRVGTTVLGFWVLSYDNEGDVDDIVLRDALAIAEDIGRALMTRRVLENARAMRAGFIRLNERIDHLESASGGTVQELERTRAVLDGLPTPLLLAQPWGRVERSNEAMRSLLGTLGVDPEEQDMLAVIVSLSGASYDDAAMLAREAIETGRGVAVPLRETLLERERGLDFLIEWRKGRGSAAGGLLLSARPLGHRHRHHESEERVSVPPLTENFERAVVGRAGGS